MLSFRNRKARRRLGGCMCTDERRASYVDTRMRTDPSKAGQRTNWVECR